MYSLTANIHTATPDVYHRCRSTGATPLMAAIVIGTNDIPWPIARITNAGRTWVK
jgi:hypothetical protein